MMVKFLQHLGFMVKISQIAKFATILWNMLETIEDYTCIDEKGAKG